MAALHAWPSLALRAEVRQRAGPGQGEAAGIHPVGRCLLCPDFSDNEVHTQHRQAIGASQGQATCPTNKGHGNRLIPALEVPQIRRWDRLLYRHMLTSSVRM